MQWYYSCDSFPYNRAWKSRAREENLLMYDYIKFKTLKMVYFDIKGMKKLTMSLEKAYNADDKWLISLLYIANLTENNI